MSLTADDITKLTQLAKINIEPEQIPVYLASLSNIMNMISEMEKVSTDSIVLNGDPLHASQPLREDIVTELDQHALFQSLSENVMAGLYLVPQVIENK
jgi:aspartyl-tRNA(Asn)/glutamyl-tRNA(Gln) amidotransferase subunit C